MHLFVAAQLIAAASTVAAVDLFVSYQAAPGAISSLSLTGTKGNLQLKEKFNNTNCGASPSWLTWDHSQNVIYCVDENNPGGAGSPGGIYSFSVKDDSSLVKVHSESTGTGPVSSVIYGDKKGNSGIVVAEYGKGGLSTFRIKPTAGDFEIGSGPSRNITFPALATPGPVQGRQTQSHAHQAILDPTGRYVVIVDLGADKIWTYTYDSTTLELKGNTVLNFPAGAGPRHAAFTKDKMYVVSELSAKVYAYKFAYNTNRTLEFTSIGEYPALAKPIAGNAPGEILITPDKKFLYISNRLTNDFKVPNYQDPKNTTALPSDSLSIFNINPDGTLKFLESTPSGGISPRHFSFTKDGEYVAVANYGSGNVAILKRNPKTGKIDGTPVAQKWWPGTAVTAAIWNECSS